MSDLKLYVSATASVPNRVTEFYDVPVVVSENLTGNDWYLMDLDEKEETMIELDEFKGWDYEELAERWNINTDGVELVRQHITDAITWNDEAGCEVLDHRVKEDMLEFLHKLIESKAKHSYGEYIFVGLLLTAAECDITFAQYFCTLLSHMWT